MIFAFRRGDGGRGLGARDGGGRCPDHNLKDLSSDAYLGDKYVRIILS